MVKMDILIAMFALLLAALQIGAINPCHQPRDPGPCKRYYPRWYYNTHARRCFRFIYRGCGGNANNFKNKRDCLQICTGSTSNDESLLGACKMPYESGPCLARPPEIRWYHDYKLGKCLTFPWGRCKPRANNYKTEQMCKETCVRENDPATAPSGPCKLPKKSGPCLALYTRWYYNFAQNKCLQFPWGGCEPNANNFRTKHGCKNRCVRS